MEDRSVIAKEMKILEETTPAVVARPFTYFAKDGSLGTTTSLHFTAVAFEAAAICVFAVRYLSTMQRHRSVKERQQNQQMV
jgi:hypothetical protein